MVNTPVAENSILTKCNKHDKSVRVLPLALAASKRQIIPKDFLRLFLFWSGVKSGCMLSFNLYNITIFEKFSCFYEKSIEPTGYFQCFSDV